MANPIVLLDARLFMAGADMSGFGNKIELNEEAEVKTVTNWRSGGAREVKAGIHGCDIMGEGHWEAGDLGKPDDALFAAKRTLDPWSAAPQSDSDLAAGGIMYLVKALKTKMNVWGDVGEVAGWSGEARSTWPLVRGVCAHPSGVPRTANGNGTGVQLGAVAADKYIYANLHVLSVAGTATPTLTVKIQSDDNSGFTTPTDRLTFTGATAISGQALRVKGPFTDTWWRAVWTITGTDPSFLFLASMGIE